MDNSKNYEYKLIKYRYLSNKNPNNPTYTYKIQKYQNRLQQSQQLQQLHKTQIGGGLFDMFRKKKPTLDEIQEILKKAIKDYSENYDSKKKIYIEKMTSMIKYLLKTINIDDLKNFLNYVEKDKEIFEKIEKNLEELKNDNN